MIETAEWDLLLRFDQLKISQQHALAWTDFEEAPITFPPTFKFDPGTETYDTSEKQRTPSWTDRVLWLAVNEGAVTPVSYNSHPEILISDHKPVSAVFKLQILTMDPEERIKVQHEVMSELDRFANDHLPDVKILPGPAVQFDRIECYKPQEQTIEVKNVGRVIAQWSFVLKPEATNLSEPWLHITPTSGLILPGERSLVHLTIHVDNETAPSLNFSTDPDALSDLLVLSIEKKDLFLSIAAREYAPTCFANGLFRLSRLKGPIRKATKEELDEVRESGEDVGMMYSIPEVVLRMVGFLGEFGAECEDLFLVSGQKELVEVVRECLDSGDEFPKDRLLHRETSHSQTNSLEAILEDAHIAAKFISTPPDSDIGVISLSPPKLRTPPSYPFSRIRPRPHSLVNIDASDNFGIHSMADCFILFLESLPEPVITFKAYPRALRVERTEDAYRVVDSLPKLNADVLLYIVSFLRVLVSHTVDPVARAARIDRLASNWLFSLHRGGSSSGDKVLTLACKLGGRSKFEVKSHTSGWSTELVGPIKMFNTAHRFGGLIHTEAPLLYVVGDMSEGDLTNLIDALPEASRTTITDLCNVHPIDGVYTGIVKSNALPHEGGQAYEGGLYGVASRFNHSCVPNVNHHFDRERKVLVYMATRDVEADEELCSYYTFLLAPSKQRKQELEERFKFTCACEVCSSDEATISASDKRRGAIKATLEAIPTLIASPLRIILKVRQAIKDLDKERLVVGMAAFAFDAYQTAVLWGDEGSAKKWATFMVECHVRADGEDAAETKEAKRLEKASPKKDPGFGKYGKKTVGGPE
ncbi:hypothetical protein P7C70_g847, partial [Phenoliferia sp. Uapishka_3]